MTRVCAKLGSLFAVLTPPKLYIYGWVCGWFAGANPFTLFGDIWAIQGIVAKSFRLWAFFTAVANPFVKKRVDNSKPSCKCKYETNSSCCCQPIYYIICWNLGYPRHCCQPLNLHYGLATASHLEKCKAETNSSLVNLGATFRRETKLSRVDCL